jgi:amidohydrolase
MNLQSIKDEAKKIFPQIVSIRHHLHAHPELSMQEKNTSAFIASRLQKLNIEFETGWAGYGITAWIKGKNPDKKTIAFRADMDALPIHEKNAVEYKSKNEGVMHACGHDVHSSCLLGMAAILNHFKNDFEGTALLIFQPSEERFIGGAQLMIEQGWLKKYHPASIIALHVYPSMEAGKVGFHAGKYMASADEIYITVKGKGGHAAMPAETLNPLFVAAKLLNRYEDLIKTFSDQKIPTVLSFGKMTADGATNVIPDELKIEGTFRTMDEAWRKVVHEEINKIATEVADEYKTEIEITIPEGSPCLINDFTLTGNTKKAAQEFLGEKNVEDLDIRMTSEDFAFFSEKLPVCFFRLGTGNKSENIISPVHTATFNIDENALEIGAGLLAYIAFTQLA